MIFNSIRVQAPRVFALFFCPKRGQIAVAGRQGFANKTPLWIKKPRRGARISVHVPECGMALLLVANRHQNH